MRIDLDYFKRLLIPFLESENAHITIDDWQQNGIEIYTGNRTVNEKFLFHITLLAENGLISDQDLETYSLDSVGLFTYLSGEMQFVKKPLRLTQKGHDFANILENSEVLNRLKSDFKNMTFDVILDSGKAIISAFAKKKLTELGLN